MVHEQQRQKRIAELQGASQTTLSSLATSDESSDDEKAQQLSQMRLVLKGDATGSIEALKAALLNLPQSTIQLRFLLAAVGAVTKSDIELAATSDATLIAFNIGVSSDAEAAAKQSGVEVQHHDVIYGVLDYVRGRMEGQIKSIRERVHRGKAVVKAIFGRGKGAVAGCLVEEGQLQAGGIVEVYRPSSGKIHEGPIESLKRFKEDVKKVRAFLLPALSSTRAAA